MQKQERQSAIVKLVETYRRVSIKSMKEELNVSEVTLRKDLMELEQQGRLVRTHGGAVCNQTSQNSPAASPIPAVQLEKVAIVAKRCVELIPENKWIYISSGVTSNEMCKFMQNCRNMNIVTSGLSTAIKLAGNKELNVFVPGGNVSITNRADYVSGDHFIKTLGTLAIDVAIVSFLGVDIENGFSVGNANEFQLVKQIKAVSKKVIVPVDSSKFGYRAFMSVAPLTYADVVVTNSDIPDEYREYFEKHNIELVLA